MNSFIEYQEKALKTDGKHELDYYILQLNREVLELLELEVNINNYNKRKDIEEIYKEFGDIFWFLFAIIEKFDLDLQEILELSVLEKKNSKIKPNNIIKKLKSKNERDLLYSKQEIFNILLIDIGRITDYFIKNKYHKHDLDKGVYDISISFILRRVLILVIKYDIDLVLILEKNIEKLQKRYNGKFSSDSSINRS